jgi:hypothetical protein
MMLAEQETVSSVSDPPFFACQPNFASRPANITLTISRLGPDAKMVVREIATGNTVVVRFQRQRTFCALQLAAAERL